MSTYIYINILLSSLLLFSCAESNRSTSVNQKVDTTNIKAIEVTQIQNSRIDKVLEEKSPSKSQQKDNILQTAAFLALESKYAEMLTPISELKEYETKIYWFIVSWLKTNYRTPNWKGYGEPGWKKKAKQRGIDCSGFARIMQDKIFHHDIRGGSRGILKKYCDKINFDDRALGDLLFFKAPNTTNDRITHVGVFLQDKFFVHATSARSAAQGFGLKIDSLDHKRWDDELVAMGRVKREFKVD